jgi:hypothetical protein
MHDRQFPARTRGSAAQIPRAGWRTRSAISGARSPSAPASCSTASPAPRSFSLPDCSNVASISVYGWQWLNTFSGAHETF